MTRTPAAAAAAGAAATGVLARRALGAEVDIDSAEVNAQIYGNLSKQAARDLRDRWASPLAETLGVSTAKLLSSYVDAIKVGIPNEGAKRFSELATKTSEAWSVPFETVVDTLGTVNSILTSTGEAFSYDKLKSTANTLQFLAAKQSTTPEKLISFLKRGAGAAQVLGMSQEAGLAFGSASTSLGNEAGASGRLFDYIASRIVELPNLVKKQGMEGKQARDLVRDLGYGNVANLDRQRRANPDAFLPDLMDRFNKISDPKKQEQALRFFAGREWLGELGRMVKGGNTYQEAVKLAQEAKTFDAIEDVWSKHKEKLSTILKRMRAGFLNILGEFGKVLTPLAAQVGDYFLAWSRKLADGGLQARVRAVIEGLIQGFGFKDLPDMLAGIFGKPEEGDAGPISQWKGVAREFASGVRDVFGSIKAVIGAFAGGDPEVIARWTGRILALSAALVMLSPVLTVLGGLSAIVQTLAASIGAVAALKGMSAGAVAGAAVWTTVGGLIGTAFLATVANQLGILKAPDTSKGWGRGIVEFLDPGLASRLFGEKNPEGGGHWTDPPLRKPVEELKESLDRNSLIHKQSFEQEKFGGLIQKAAYSTSGTAAALRSDLGAMGSAFRNSPMAGSIGGGGIGGFTGGPLSNSTPGSALNGGSGLSRRGIMGGGGSNPGGATASSAPGRGSANYMVGQHGPAGSNLTTIMTASGKRVTVHKAAAENFRGFINELEASGYKINSLGGHNHRNIRGGSRLSQHAFGNAIDINPAQNPMGPNLITDLPKNVSGMAAKWGLSWGGDWKRRKDAMHFEWTGRTLDQLKNGAVSGQSTGSGSVVGGLTGVIDRAAAAAGIDPRIMHGIRAGESGHRADYDKNISAREESYGPFQLNRKGGLGTIFERETGLDLKNPATIQAQAFWVANHIKKKLASNPTYNPRSEWYGFKGLMQSDPRWGDSGLIPDGSTAPDAGGQSISHGMPLPPNRPVGLGASTPIRSSAVAAGRIGASGNGSVNAPITIQGSSDPEATANAVQRKLREGMNRRTHDLDPTVV